MLIINLLKNSFLIGNIEIQNFAGKTSLKISERYVADNFRQRRFVRGKFSRGQFSGGVFTVR